MEAQGHPAFREESDHLGTVLQVFDEQIRDAATGAWAGGADNWAAAALETHFGARKQRLEEAAGHPYFGRIDVLTDGQGQPESYYLGEMGLRGHGDKRLVIDWRRGVGTSFYRPGPDVHLKRRFTIYRRTHHGIADDRVLPPRPPLASQEAPAERGETHADPFLAEVLAAARISPEMGMIVATIQAEQDELVRSEDPVLLIQGGAGTGKTVVALHRLAYLLYHHRTETALKRDLRVAVVGPSRVFLHYIQGVLSAELPVHPAHHGICQRASPAWNACSS